MKIAFDSHDCKKELRSIDLKATPARLGVLEALEQAEIPMDIAMLVDYLKNKRIRADRVTVFRIMNTLTEKGMTNPIQFHEGKTRYELANKDHHHHLICENCGRIESIEDLVVPELEKNIKKKHNFTVKRHSLEFFGLCKDCKD